MRDIYRVISKQLCDARMEKNEVRLDERYSITLPFRDLRAPNSGKVSPSVLMSSHSLSLILGKLTIAYGGSAEVSFLVAESRDVFMIFLLLLLRE